MNWILIITAITLLLLTPLIKSQQNYTGSDSLDCDETNKTSSLYTCNGEYPSCRAFLLFTAYPPYVKHTSGHCRPNILVPARNPTAPPLRTGQDIIVPVNCSCSDNHYQATTTYQVQTQLEFYYTIANDTFQGLSTCYHPLPTSLLELRVPLRCACPTREQASEGTRFLMTYSLKLGDSIYSVGKRFNVSLKRMIEANVLSENFPILFNFTTILIPLSSEPSAPLVTSNDYNQTELPPFVNVAVISKSSRFLSPAVISAIVISLLIILLMLVAVVVFVCRERRERRAMTSSPRYHLKLEIARFDQALKVFEFSKIKKATGNFGSNNRVEGTVYRGNFRGEIMAVKKKNIGKTENEVKMLQQINHFNIVKLHGFCQHKDNLYLVYDYLKNGTLREWLIQGKEVSLKTFNQRILIALDVANGLLYLHNFMNPTYVHNNLNSNNILLDFNLRAKISNFSLVERAACDSMTGVVGEEVYVAPERLEAARVSPKVDVFAFGMMLLEILTGKCPVFNGGERLLWMTTADAVMERQGGEIDQVRELVDHCVGENEEMMEYVVQLVQLGLRCLRQDPANRPDMVEVVKIIQKVQFQIHNLVNGVGEMRDLSRKYSVATFSTSSFELIR